MAGEWPTVALGEVAINLDTRRVPVKASDRVPGPYPYYGASGVVDHVNGYLFDGSYLLVAEDGENLRTRQTPVAFMANGKFWVNNHAHILEGGDRALTRYLAYALSQADISAYITGAVMPKLTQANLSLIPIPLPSLPEQGAIVELLGSLDDKIELNRRIAATLEEMARAIFKSWFVDFDPVRAKAEGRAPGLPAATAALFPDAFGEDGIPVGWGQEPLSPSLVELVTRGVTPVYADEGLAVVNQKCIRNGQVNLALARRHDLSSKGVPDAKLLRSGDILINSTGAGTLGRVAQVRLLDTAATVDTHVTIVRPSRNDAWSNYLGLQLSAREEEIEQLGHGSTGQTELSRDAISSLNVVVPSDQVLQVFAEVTAPMLSQADAALAENVNLGTLRDTLLPKLISGALRIKNAHGAVEAA